MAQNKVFGSDITRTHNKLKNNLYDIIKVDPVVPLVINDTKNVSCKFVPKTDKYFIPKKKVRIKVKTVRNIRDLFEKDTYSILESELEKQQNILLRKIRGGSSRDEKTKVMARSMLNTDKPISRMAWQMLTNINPDDHAHSSQYVLYNGKCVQVNGSKGGKNKFICKYDLGIKRAFMLQRPVNKTNLTAKKSLLKNSLHVKFKPGPLSKKRYLDISYQKHNIGSIKLAHLPKTGLDIIPEIGKPLESSITNFLHNLRDVNGIISDKWAEFAISTLGIEENGRAVQLNKDCCITFNLNYKYEQRNLLMRHSVDAIDYEQTANPYIETEKSITQEVKNMLDEMLISIEIHLLQDNMYSGQDAPREVDANDIATGFNGHKIRQKGELGRLDVTVIRLSDIEKNNKVDACGKSFCNLGCICDSLFSSIHLKNHCGRIECMFECKCDFFKYNPHGCIEDEIPALVHLDKENNLKLSKEEKKFHQTVVLSGEKSILLKSQKRNWRAPKKYADFYSNMCLKTKKKAEKILSVLDIKLNCGNVEPWCMVHNLYKCFCKGKFTERLTNNVQNDLPKNTENNSDIAKLSEHESLKTDPNIQSEKSIIERPLRLRIPRDIQTMDKTDGKLPIIEKIYASHNPTIDDQEICARTNKFKGRKYRDNHYFKINKKIKKMERNDTRLLERMKKLAKKKEDDTKKTNIDTNELPIIDLCTSPDPDHIDESLKQTKDVSENELSVNVSPTPICNKMINNKPLNLNVQTWLLPTLKIYGDRINKGNFKKTLDPPKAGKIALYPWDFILKRYHERKNFFFVTEKRPFRIFLAVDCKNTFFNTCINLNSIVDTQKYPTSVKSIINNDIEGLKDQMCILRGLEFCWEFVGSLQKLRESDNNSSEVTFKESSVEIGECSIQYPTNSNTSPAKTATDSPLPVPENITDKSKWFVMTIENDFTEIQFYTRGFFVKHESIINAINVARISENTVRLSSQKCVEGTNDPQFGIYAIPNVNEYCVLIGPYEKNEPLGIETIKCTLYSGKKRTRGVWITTNKIDNPRVIDNPLSFMSYVNLEHEQVLDDSIQDELNERNINPISGVAINQQKIVKLTKPIKIAKTNNFYQLTSSGLLKQVPSPTEKQNCIAKAPYLINRCLSQDIEGKTINPLFSKASSLILQSNKTNPHSNVEKQSVAVNVPPKKPIAEIAPQIKTIKESPDSSIVPPKESSRKCGMFVLKPEEINIRSLENKISCTSTTSNYDIPVATGEIDMDIENFLANSAKCTEPSPDIYIVSDDEDYCNKETDIKKNCWNYVFIVCKNVENIGWISGRQDVNKHLSFEFPGFKYTEFYAKEEAFAKINQVLSRKIYIPKHLYPNWYVVETKDDLKDKQKLKQEDLGPDYVLTKHGLLHKFDIAARLSNKTDSQLAIFPPVTSANIKKEETDMVLSTMDIDELENQSNLLSEEGEQLWSEAVVRKGELSMKLSNMSNDDRQQISNRLRSIISNVHNS